MPKSPKPAATSSGFRKSSSTRPLVRYAALLRGVSPMNCSMPALKAALEAHGFVDVKTILASGNAIFSAPDQPDEAVARACEAAMREGLDRTFSTIVRRVEPLRTWVASDPFADLTVPPGSKKVVAFLPSPIVRRSELPLEFRGATIQRELELEVLATYVPGPDGPAFMTLLEKTYGKTITTRTWGTVERLVR